jgi:hydrophobic/amphiphilic exporter-1 (mainly G- bacteria), HAE1 family
MTLSGIAIRRPVFTTMVLSAIVVFGAISFQRLGIDLFPRVEFSTISVVTVLPGADPETVESTVTDVIEEAVSTISQIKDLRSTSADGTSLIIIEFEMAKDIDVAYQEVQAKIATVRRDLPDDIDPPAVEKFDVDAQPILSVVVSADMPIRDLTRLADKVVKERLQRIPNVGQVRLVGDRERQLWIRLDHNRLMGHNLTVQEVENALLTEHVEIPGGRIESGLQEFVVKTKAEFESAEALERMIVAYRGDAPIRLADVGWVEDGLAEERSLARLNGARALALMVRRQSGTNTAEVADAVKAEVNNLRRELASQGVTFAVALDKSVFIKDSVREVQFHLLFGGGLAIFVVWVFLRNLRSTFISSLVLPTSLIGTFIIMYVLGFTQNTLTLLGLSLAIGLLIDDAIVVQENITRHIEEGKSPRRAAEDATREITLAVIATTLTVVAVFVPVAFMKGVIGQFFFQFGLTVAFAAILSTFVSLTLDPMLSSRILRKARPGGLYQFSERGFRWIEALYCRLIALALRARWLVVLIAVASMLATAWMGRSLRSEFLPVEDQSEFNIKVKAPLGASLAATDAALEKIRARLEGAPWIEYTFATIGTEGLSRVNEGNLYVKMLDKHERSISQEAAMIHARERIGAMHEGRVSVEVVPRIGGGGRTWADLQLDLRGPDLEVLNAIASGALEVMARGNGYRDLDTTYEFGKPEVNVYVKREEAADLGVDPLTVASTIRALVGGHDIARFREGGDRYDISVRLTESQRDAPALLRLLTVRNNRGRLISLENVARVVEEPGPVQIDRYNRARQITVLANLNREEKVLGEAVAEVSAWLDAQNLPPGYTYGFAGLADLMDESFYYLLQALLLAVLIIYMVLAAQFESFVHPFTIMLALPLSIVGAVGALVLTGLTMNIYTMIGIILLMGLVAKNGILLVDYTNTLRERDGMARDAALLKAGPTRLRPILMTTLTLIFGMLPLAVGSGAGAETRQPMATAIIGGLITSTLLTLIVVPVVYTILDDLAHPSTWRLTRLWNALHHSGDAPADAPQHPPVNP